MLPLEGRPITLRFEPGLRAWRGRFLPAADPRGAEVHAATFIRRREIVLDAALRRDRRDFSRILVHEIFHFAWVRLGNPRRREFERLLAAEARRGELGWSAEMRKRVLRPRDRVNRTRAWREYVCESFCDTGAWLYSGVRRHAEFTLPLRFRPRRRAWFRAAGFDARIPV